MAHLNTIGNNHLALFAQNLVSTHFPDIQEKVQNSPLLEAFMSIEPETHIFLALSMLIVLFVAASVVYKLKFAEKKVPVKKIN